MRDVGCAICEVGCNITLRFYYPTSQISHPTCTYFGFASFGIRSWDLK
jgi:hypothetical protein